MSFILLSEHEKFIPSFGLLFLTTYPLSLIFKDKRGDHHGN